LAPLLLALTGFALRLINLATPKGLVFDELYYVDGARDLLAHGVEVTGSKPEFVVHPPLGKWLIAIGIKIFGNHEFGWRIATAIAGALLIYLTARTATKLFASPLLGGIAGFLAFCDGLALVHSRTALLDLFLALFVLAGAYAWLLDRHFIAAITFGLACSIKWSGIYFLLFFLLWTLWRDYQMGAGLIALTIRKLEYLLVAALTYCSTWSGWFLSDGGWSRHWSDDRKSVFTFHSKFAAQFFSLPWRNSQFSYWINNATSL
jgi:predicted membrane-bound dolichyl-phosphate-mannose-protein mannosyltransferase